MKLVSRKTHFTTELRQGFCFDKAWAFPLKFVLVSTIYSGYFCSTPETPWLIQVTAFSPRKKPFSKMPESPKWPRCTRKWLRLIITTSSLVKFSFDPCLKLEVSAVCVKLFATLKLALLLQIRAPAMNLSNPTNQG